MGLREGKNREIKKVLEHLGLAVNRLIRVSFGPFELGDLAEGEAAEVRTRVLRDQLGVKLAKEAQADFDAPLIAREAPTPDGSRARTSGARGARAPSASGPGAISPIGTGSAGAARNGERRFDPDAAAHRPPPSAVDARAPPQACVAPAGGDRRRRGGERGNAIERSATHDRKGRTIAVERISPTREEARRRAAAETRRPRTGRRKTGAGAAGGA